MRQRGSMQGSYISGAPRVQRPHQVSQREPRTVYLEALSNARCQLVAFRLEYFAPEILGREYVSQCLTPQEYRWLRNMSKTCVIKKANTWAHKQKRTLAPKPTDAKPVPKSGVAKPMPRPKEPRNLRGEGHSELLTPFTALSGFLIRCCILEECSDDAAHLGI